MFYLCVGENGTETFDLVLDFRRRDDLMFLHIQRGPYFSEAVQTNHCWSDGRPWLAALILPLASRGLRIVPLTSFGLTFPLYKKKEQNKIV